MANNYQKRNSNLPFDQSFYTSHQPIEGSTYALDVNEVDDQFRHERQQLTLPFLDEGLQFMGENPVNQVAAQLVPVLHYANTINSQLTQPPQMLAEPQNFSAIQSHAPQAAAEVTIDIGPPLTRFPTPALYPLEYTNPEDPCDPVSEDWIQMPDHDLLPHSSFFPLGEWYQHAFQTTWSRWTMTGLHPVQEAYIANNLELDDAAISSNFYAKFPGTLVDAARVARRTTELRKEAKERCWSQEETEILTQGAMRGMLGSEVYAALKMKWREYPKTYRYVLEKYKKVNVMQAEIEEELSYA